MKTTLIFLTIAISAFQCIGATREKALAPHISYLMKNFSELPAEYQRTHKQTLEQYLNLFTSSNDITWNTEWESFLESMGQEFAPYKADVLEAMVVAETYQACYPDPQIRIPQIASVLFDQISKNALVFVHQDVFSSILQIEQQASGKREDVVIINSARIMDSSYQKILASRYPSLMGLDKSAIERVFDEAKKQKLAGNREFKGLEIIDGKVRVHGYDIMCSLSLIMMKEISKSNPSRPAVILPSVREFWKPIQAWNTLNPNGIFCVWDEDSASAISNPSSNWIEFINTVAPINSPLQVRLSNSLGKIVNAHAFVCKTNGNEELAKELFNSCGKRMKSVRIVKGESITIDKSGKMVEPPN
jgi:hypothetical protein